MLVAEEPIEVTPMGSSMSVRAGESTLRKSDTGSAGTAADVARPCNAWGIALITREPFDTIDCDTAAPCPAGLVVGGGSANGVSVDAVAADPAYPYIAVASWAHISAYWTSVAAIAAVFCPSTLVAINVISRLRLAAITGGGTVIANAAS